ncbi:amino acid ABC transporter substrate-binding protein [Chromobacterium sp. IIBBL 290-4]|uniref:amino acid ABC transporter substrate-binding protein n=1 Tax=Chromobacterium sp. IIBBL 290-4 TaxID=2953890 RepID=UPI0020B8A899|nr:amino acid ABC transporter substrate-binding protein [Chromobacterium sp. IIBBL 290-4]UTH73164.1 amino acid ABC transporter substrate-binding protein [Chromobacterium sp. IIBBL 290-4]
MQAWKSTAALALTVFAAFAHADDLADIRKAGVLKIGTEGTYAPFTYHNPAGDLTGFDIEIGQAIAKRLGVKAQFVEGKWDGLIAGLDVKRYDVVINEVAVTDARKAKYDFSEPYIVSKAVLIVRNDNRDIKRFEDLKGRKSANTLTSNFGKLAQRYGAEVVATQGFNESVALLESGRVETTINDSLSFLDYKKKQPGSKLKIAATESSGEPSAVLLRKGNPELKAAIDKALAALKADGSYQKISHKYFGADVSR